MEEPAAAAQRQLEAYNARDIEAFLSVYDDACVVSAFPSGEVMFAGKPAMRARYGPMFAAHPQLHCDLVARVVFGPFAIDEEHVTGLVADQVVHAVAMYEVRNALIVRVWFFKDPQAPAR